MPTGDKFGWYTNWVKCGFGAIRYAEVYPHLYNFAASFSGALDLLDWRTQSVILGSETIDKKQLDGPFGGPYLPWTSSG